jgi:hypothetical protein
MKNLKINIPSFLTVSFICILLIGIPLFLFPPSFINPDSFYHIAIANYYLFAPEIVIRDTFTGGPVIPAILFLIKKVFLSFVENNSFVDVITLKIVAFLLYLSIALSGFKIIENNNYYRSGIFWIILIFGLLKIDTDTMSENGELFGVAMILLIFNLYKLTFNNSVRYFLIALFSVMVIYTKVQLIPLLFLTLMSEADNDKVRFEVFSKTFCLLFLFEIFFYYENTGLLRSAFNLLTYITQGAFVEVNNSFYVALKNKKELLIWMFERLNDFFPILPIIIIYLIFGDETKKNEKFYENWLFWALITSVSILLPGRAFSHYILLALPFIFKFIGRVDLNIFNTKKHRYKSGICFIFIFCALIRTNDLLKENHSNRLFKNSFQIEISDQIKDVQSIISKNPGSIFVHGWDYHVHSYLNIYSPTKNELYRVHGKGISAHDYISELIAKDYNYLIDITKNSGLIRGAENSLASDELFKKFIDKKYKIIYSKNGVDLYYKVDKN